MPQKAQKRADAAIHLLNRVHQYASAHATQYAHHHAWFIRRVSGICSVVRRSPCPVREFKDGGVAGNQENTTKQHTTPEYNTTLKTNHKPHQITTNTNKQTNNHKQTSEHANNYTKHKQTNN